MKDAAELNTPAPNPPRDLVHLPRPDARENPNDFDIQEGHERMQGEATGRQDAEETTKLTELPNP